MLKTSSQFTTECLPYTFYSVLHAFSSPKIQSSSAAFLPVYMHFLKQFHAHLAHQTIYTKISMAKWIRLGCCLSASVLNNPVPDYLHRAKVSFLPDKCIGSLFFFPFMISLRFHHKIFQKQFPLFSSSLYSLNV